MVCGRILCLPHMRVHFLPSHILTSTWTLVSGKLQAQWLVRKHPLVSLSAGTECTNRKAIKLWSIMAQSATWLNPKDGISEARSSEDPTGSSFNKQPDTGLPLPSGEWAIAGVSPGTKQRQIYLLPTTQRSRGEHPSVRSSTACNACLPPGCGRH